MYISRVKVSKKNKMQRGVGVLFQNDPGVEGVLKGGHSWRETHSGQGMPGVWALSKNGLELVVKAQFPHPAGETL